MRQVIVGAGPAGVCAAEALRRSDPKQEIVVVSREPGPPDARMALPYLLADAIDERGTWLRRSESHYADLGIELRQATVEGLEPTDRRLLLADGEKPAYDRLLIATGSNPRVPALAGMDQPGVHHCWTLAEAREIAARAKEGARVVQIGAGFVACIIMKALVARGVKLTVVTGSSGRMVRSMLCPTAGGLLRRWCESKGVDIVTGETLAAVEPGPTVVCESGRELQADLVIVAVGVDANLGFLEGTGIEVDRGILVDDHLRTSLPGIFAAGDVAQGQSFGAGQELEVHAIHPTAVQHGLVAARNMAGETTPFPGSLRMNVLDTAGLASCGLGQWQEAEGAELAETLDEERWRFLRLAFRDDRLVGANAVAADMQQVGALRGLIQTRARLGKWKDRLMAAPFRFPEAFVATTHGV